MVIGHFDPTKRQPLDCLSLLIPTSFQTPLWLVIHWFNVYSCSCFTTVLTTWTNSATDSLLIPPFKLEFTNVKCSSWRNRRKQQKHTLGSTEIQQKYLHIADDYKQKQNSLCRLALFSTWNEFSEFGNLLDESTKRGLAKKNFRFCVCVTLRTTTNLYRCIQHISQTGSWAKISVQCLKMTTILDIC